MSGYRDLLIEVCKNEIDQRRGEFLSQKAKYEGNEYCDPYQLLVKKMKKDKEIRIIVQVEEEEVIVQGKRLHYNNRPMLADFPSNH